MNTSPDTIAAPFLDQVSIATGVRVDTLLGPSTDCNANKARQTAIALIYQLTPIGIHTIGDIFRRDHKSIYYALNRVSGRASTDPGYARHLRQLIGQRQILRPLAEPVARGTRPQLVPETETVSTISPSTHGRLHELKPKAIDAKLQDAREQLAYWTMKKATATSAGDRSAAAARLLIWTGEVDACERRRREIDRTEAITA